MKFGKKFKPVKIKDEDLIDEIDELRDRKRGIRYLLEDLAINREGVETKISKWFDKVYKTYKIPKEYRNKVTYIHSTKEIELKD